MDMWGLRAVLSVSNRVKAVVRDELGVGGGGQGEEVRLGV